MVHPRLRPEAGATILQPAPQGISRRGISRWAGRAAMAVLLALALLGAGLFAPPARAQGGEEAFTVRGVAVDVTADNAAAARDQAIMEGQRKAFQQLLLNLTTPDEVARLPPLDDTAIGNMVLDFEVESESVSTVRYIGNLAFRFRAQPVQDYLQQGGASYAMGAGRPALVLPVLTRDGQSLLWDDGNGWLAAWSSSSVDTTLVSFVAPLGDLTDIATIDAARALDGDSAALQAMATRYAAGDVVVAEARPAIDPATGEASVELDATRYTLAGPAGSMQDRLSAPGGEAALAELYGQAAQRVSGFVQDQLKQENLVSSSVEQRLAVVAPLSGLEAWVDLKRRLADVPVIRQAELRELSKSQAKLDLVFLGDQAQLHRALAQRDLSLSPIAAASPAPATVAPPQTSGSVTVDPGAVPPAVAVPAAAEPVWELRRGPATAPAIQPAVQPGAQSPGVAPAQPAVAPATPAVDPAAQPSAPAE